MTFDTNATEQEKSQALLQQINVKLSFSLDEINISLLELKSLHTGQTFNTGRLLADPVSVYANDILIAHGNLVNIEGNLGVTISELVEDKPNGY